MIVTEQQYVEVLAEIDGGIGVDGRVDEGVAGDLFRELRFQRKSVFRAEQKAAMGEEAGGDDGWSWETLFETALDYLVTHAKDLEVMAILLESATRTGGLPSLVRSAELMAELIEKYWEAGLFPVEDEEDGVEARFQPISGLSGGGSDKDGTLILPLRRMELAGRGDDALQYLDRVVADAQLVAAQSGSGRDEAVAEAQAALDEIESKARRLSRAPIAAAIVKLGEAEANWRRSVGYISERTKPRFPAASRVSDELRAMRDWLEGLTRALPDDGPGEDAVAVEGGTVVAAGGAAAGGAPQPFSIGRIERREDALRAVNAAAEFFERTEPHSPIGSTLQEVGRRARLSMGDFLKELIPDSDARRLYYWRSGIKPPADE